MYEKLISLGRILYALSRRGIDFTRFHDCAGVAEFSSVSNKTCGRDPCACSPSLSKYQERASSYRTDCSLYKVQYLA